MILTYRHDLTMSRYVLQVMCLLILCGCAGTGDQRFNTPQAKGYYADQATQCVPFAREASGIPIYGDAHTWWFQVTADKHGSHPQRGAVLVLAKTNKLRYGHLAVVKNVIAPHQIAVTHSNWGSDSKTRRIIYQSMLVEDISPANDWSNVRFWNKDINAFGLPYAAYGFVYQ